MKKYFLQIYFILLFLPFLCAQGEKAIFIELGGRGIFYSANFDYRFSKNYSGLGITSGIEFLPLPSDQEEKSYIFSLGVELNKTWGQGNWYPEVGVGLDYFKENDFNSVLPRLTAAVRFQKPYSGFFFRPAINFIGILQPENSSLPPFWGGIGLGFSFN